MHRLTTPPRRHPHTGQRQQRGVTLLESLIALLIAALGILGIVGVQMRTLTDTQTSVRRAQAIRLIEDLSERMRVNPNGLAQITNYESGFDDNTAPDHSACDSGCTPAEQAEYDIHAWKQTVRSMLPLGQASVFLAPGEAVGNNRQLGIIISWRENERADADADYLSALNATTSSGGTDADNACPPNSTCHLQYIAVPARCGLDSNRNQCF